MTMATRPDTPALALLEPMQLGAIQLHNHVVMAPMTRCRAGVGRMPNALML